MSGDFNVFFFFNNECLEIVRYIMVDVLMLIDNSHDKHWYSTSHGKAWLIMLIIVMVENVVSNDNS